MASGDAALMRLEIAGSIPAMGGAGYSPSMVKQSFVGKSKKTVAGAHIGSVFNAYHYNALVRYQRPTSTLQHWLIWNISSFGVVFNSQCETVWPNNGLQHGWIQKK